MNLRSLLPKREAVTEEPPPFTFFTKTAVRQSPPTPLPSTIEERAAIVAEIASLRTRVRCRKRAIAAQIASAEDGADRLRARAREAEARLAALRIESMTASVNQDNAEARLLVRLRASASPLVDLFQAELVEQMDAARAAGVLRVVERPAREVAGEKVRGQFESNAESVARRLAALRRAHATAEELRTEPIAEEELRTRLLALREAVPDIAPLLVEQPLILTRAEQRVVAWAHGSSA